MQAINVIMGKDMSAQVRLYLTWISNYNPEDTPTIITAINIIFSNFSSYITLIYCPLKQ